MDMALRHGLSFCIASDRVIFLDLLRNRYFCLSPRANAAFMALADEAVPPSEREQLKADLPIDLFVGDGHGPPSVFPAACKPPSGSLVDRPLPRPSIAALGGAMSQLSLATLVLKLLPLATIVTHIKLRKDALSSALPPDYPTLLNLCAAYERSSVHITRNDRCLPRSLAMARHLLSLGIVPDLIFAVMVRPFQAHCWFQYGNHVLNDRLDNVRNFTPILIV